MNLVYVGRYYVKGFGPIALYTNEYYDGAGVYYGLWRSAGLSGMDRLVGNDAKFSEEDLNREDVPGYVGDYVRARLREAGYGRTTKSEKAALAAAWKAVLDHHKEEEAEA